jgi:hypothetical protein
MGLAPKYKSKTGLLGPACNGAWNQTQPLVLSGPGHGWLGAGSLAWPPTALKSNRPP